MKQSLTEINSEICGIYLSSIPLAILRISLALVLIIQNIFIFDQIFEYYGNNGIIKKEVSDYLYGSTPLAPDVSIFHQLLSPLGITYSFTALIIYSLFLSSLFFLLIGWKTRIFAFLVWFLQMTLTNTAPLASYGVDSIQHVFLFYLMILPCGETLSLDSLTNPPSGSHSITALTRSLGLRLMQLNVCLIYFQSGLAKTSGTMWWNGEAIWTCLMDPGYRQYDFSWMAQYPWVAVGLCWATLIIEVGYPFFIFPKKTQFLWAMLAIGLHLGIAFFQGLWFFSLTMIALNISLFLSEKFSQALSEKLNLPVFSPTLSFRMKFNKE